MPSHEEIVDFARQWSASNGPCGPDEDLFDAFRIAGDDGDEFLDAYAERYGVDLSEFLWYFHYNANEPPFHETCWPYAPDGRKLERIPLSPVLLALGAQKKRWPVAYPEHVARRLWGFWITWVAIVAATMAISWAVLHFI